jgi:hypothetical protein
LEWAGYDGLLLNQLLVDYHCIGSKSSDDIRSRQMKRIYVLLLHEIYSTNAKEAIQGSSEQIIMKQLSLNGCAGLNECPCKELLGNTAASRSTASAEKTHGYCGECW